MTRTRNPHPVRGVPLTRHFPGSRGFLLTGGKRHRASDSSEGASFSSLAKLQAALYRGAWAPLAPRVEREWAMARGVTHCRGGGGGRSRVLVQWASAAVDSHQACLLSDSCFRTSRWGFELWVGFWFPNCSVWVRQALSLELVASICGWNSLPQHRLCGLAAGSGHENNVRLWVGEEVALIRVSFSVFLGAEVESETDVKVIVELRWLLPDYWAIIGHQSHCLCRQFKSMIVDLFHFFS